MEKRNLTPLRNVLVRYLVVCGGGSIVILLVWWGLFMSLIRNGFLLPPVTGAQVCSEARDYAATATVETFDPNAIDPLCRYAILQAGTAHVLQTNMTAGQLKKARNILTGGRQWVVASYQCYQYVVDMADGARCILQYDYSGKNAPVVSIRARIRITMIMTIFMRRDRMAAPPFSRGKLRYPAK